MDVFDTHWKLCGPPFMSNFEKLCFARRTRSHNACVQDGWAELSASACLWEHLSLLMYVKSVFVLRHTLLALLWHAKVNKELGQKVASASEFNSTWCRGIPFGWRTFSSSPGTKISGFHHTCKNSTSRLKKDHIFVSLLRERVWERDLPLQVSRARSFGLWYGYSVMDSYAVAIHQSGSHACILCSTIAVVREMFGIIWVRLEGMIVSTSAQIMVQLLSIFLPKRHAVVHLDVILNWFYF